MALNGLVKALCWERGRAQLSQTILVVDDEPILRKFVSTLLKAKRYTVLTAEDGDDAIRQSREHEGPIHLLISNIQMPGISGVELAAKINIERPEINVMLMSGFQSGILVLKRGMALSAQAVRSVAVAKPHRSHHRPSPGARPERA